MPSTIVFRIGWLILLLAGAIWETLAILHPGSGDTLTYQVRSVLVYPPVWFAAAGIAIWALGHFFFPRLGW